MKKFLTVMFACALVLSMACSKGHEAASKDQGEDDEAEQTNTATATATASGAAPAAATPAVADAGTLNGSVKFEGAAPKEPTIQMSADPYCQSQHPGGKDAQDEEVVVGPAGELANVIVYVKNAPAGAAVPSTPATLEQRGCRYYPHVNAVMVGQPLQIKNDDDTLHNVHAMPDINSQFNEGQPVKGMVSTKKFDKVEIKPFRIKCDVHGWMKSWMAVMPHPYFSVSQMNGTFSIGNLPPGNYTIVAWHEKYGQQEQQVTVGPKETKQIAFSFKG